MDLEELAESARNRGLKLVRSRIRTPGKGDYGKVGLAGPSGNPVFGMEGRALTATPEEVRDHLRKLEAADWGASVKAAGQARKPGHKTSASKPPPKAPAPARPRPIPAVRLARQADAPQLLPLLQLLGYSLDRRALAGRLAKMIKSDCTPLVATLGKTVIGLCGVQVSTMLQRERPVGRITVLVVAEEERGNDVGRMLVTAAEDHFREKGCELIEVTSNDRHLGAHAFYRRMGFERTSIRFAKPLD